MTDGRTGADAGQVERNASDENGTALTGFSGVTWVPIAANVDERGTLLELDFDAVKFAVRRVFMITEVPAGTKRGGHRHHSGAQVLVCVVGRIEVELRRDEARTVVTLTPQTGGLCIPAGVWAAQRYLEEGSLLVVLASHPFDPSSYETSI